jgi:hypothetical protein
LDALLESLRPAVAANLKTVARDERAAAMLATTFRKLPDQVKLTGHSLHIEFYGTEDFLEAVGALVYALHNDYDQISRFIEDHGGAPLALPRLFL